MSRTPKIPLCLQNKICKLQNALMREYSLRITNVHLRPKRWMSRRNTLPVACGVRKFSCSCKRQTTFQLLRISQNKSWRCKSLRLSLLKIPAKITIGKFHCQLWRGHESVQIQKKLCKLRHSVDPRERHDSGGSRRLARSLRVCWFLLQCAKWRSLPVLGKFRWRQINAPQLTKRRRLVNRRRANRRRHIQRRRSLPLRRSSKAWRSPHRHPHRGSIH